MPGYVYIMANKPNGTLYIGVTSNLVRRVYEHREGVVDGFTDRYDIKRLVYFEQYDEMERAIQREKTMKKWPRDWKVALVNQNNEKWVDLFPGIASG
ncbi:MAG: GIY-YIG nuclease family protein [Dongiaceae bacterium]